MKNETKTVMTAGQERRYAKKQAAAQAKSKARREKIAGIIAAAVIVVAVAAIIWASGRNSVYDTYTDCFKKDGSIKGTNVSKDVTLPDLPDIVIKKADYEFTDADVQAEIDELLEQRRNELIAEQAEKAGTEEPEEDLSDEDYEEDIPEVVFDDAFVSGYLGSDLTADEYRAKIKADMEEELIDDIVVARLLEAAKIASYPKKFMRTISSLTKSNNDSILAQYQAYGLTSATSYHELLGLTEEEYLADVEESTEEEVYLSMIYQAIYEKFKLAPDKNEYAEFVKTLSDEYEYDPADYNGIGFEENVGKAYIMVEYIGRVAFDYAKEHMTIER